MHKYLSIISAPNSDSLDDAPAPGALFYDTTENSIKMFSDGVWNMIDGPLTDEDRLWREVTWIEDEKEQGCYESTR